MPWRYPGVLLDTNVVSELFRTTPNSRVMAFLDAERSALLPVIAIHELEYGLARLPAGRRRDKLSRFLREITRLFADRILHLTRDRAREGALIRAQAERVGRVLGTADALIAGTARADALMLATRNVRHFEGIGIGIVDPWQGPRRPDKTAHS